MLSVGPYTLYWYQERIVNQLRQKIRALSAAGKPPHILLQAPCAAGKSTTSAFLAQSTSDHGNRFLFMVAGRSLVAQMSEKLAECQVHHGILMADSDRAITHEYASHNQKTLEFCPIVIASRDTYDSRVLNRQTVQDMKVQVILIDEADNGHKGKVYQKLIKENTNVTIIGTTATPSRANGKGLGDLYQDIVLGVTHKELLDGGFIVPPVIFGRKPVDMVGVKISKTTGDYVQEEAAERFDKPELIGDLVRDWKEFAQKRPTVVFAQSVAHSQHCAHTMTACGIPAEHMDAQTPLSERQRMFKALETGGLIAICNYGVFSRGIDVPVVGCCVLARAMCSLNVFLQTTGRIFRSCKTAYWAPGGAKPNAIIIDHAANVSMHGWPQKDRPWPMDPGRTVDDEALEEKHSEPQEAPLCHCPKCGGEWSPRSGFSGCPNCGYEKFKLGLQTRFDGQRLTQLREEKMKPQKSPEQILWSSVLARMAFKDRSYGAAVKVFERESGKTFSSVAVFPTLPYDDRHQKIAEVWPNFARRRRRSA